MAERSIHLGDSPLTDPRALLGSALVHGLILLAASFVMYQASAPRSEPEPSRTMRAEFDDAVDNRARLRAGGGTGAQGGEGRREIRVATEADASEGSARKSAEDALLAEIVPTTPAAPAPTEKDVPGPETTGVGVLPGLGMGGGGGSGGGSGGGKGRGIGPGTEFFGARDHADSFAYVIDCSGSMGSRNALDIAKRELLTSLDVLPPDALFGVVFYNSKATIFSDPEGRIGLMKATAANKSRVRTQLTSVEAMGGTDHMLALRTALALNAEVIFFLTDAASMTDSDVRDVLKIAGKTRIQTVEFGVGIDLGEQKPLRSLAERTGASYRYINVEGFRGMRR